MSHSSSLESLLALPCTFLSCWPACEDGFSDEINSSASSMETEKYFAISSAEPWSYAGVGQHTQHGPVQDTLEPLLMHVIEAEATMRDMVHGSSRCERTARWRQVHHVAHVEICQQLRE